MRGCLIISDGDRMDNASIHDDCIFRKTPKQQGFENWSYVSGNCAYHQNDHEIMEELMLHHWIYWGTPFADPIFSLGYVMG